MKINIRRAIVSGIIAGLVIMLLGAVLVPIIGDQMNTALEKLSLSPLSNGAMTYFAIISLILGIAIMVFYALIQHKFRSELNAILTVSLFFWFFTYFWSNAALVAYGFLPLKLVVVGTSWGLLELLVATLVGSKIYKSKKL